jgi:hypothetical protein
MLTQLKTRTMQLAFAAVLSVGVATPAAADVNLIPGNWSLISRPLGEGVLRPASGWEAGSTPSDVIALVDGVFAPEMQQWNNGSFWWDETQTVSPFNITIRLARSFTFSSLVIQADNNEDYLVDYWDGNAWVNVFNAPAIAGFGLMTRTSGPLSFTTDRFRLSARGGDQFYSISEFQAFGAVPEPATWGFMILGFGLIGGTLRSVRYQQRRVRNPRALIPMA